MPVRDVLTRTQRFESGQEHPIRTVAAGGGPYSFNTEDDTIIVTGVAIGPPPSQVNLPPAAGHKGRQLTLKVSDGGFGGSAILHSTDGPAINIDNPNGGGFASDVLLPFGILGAFVLGITVQSDGVVWWVVRIILGTAAVP